MTESFLTSGRMVHVRISERPEICLADGCIFSVGVSDVLHCEADT